MTDPTSRSQRLSFQTDFTPDEFAQRRAKLMSAMSAQGIALVAGAPEAPGFDPFRQTNDFYYLCGVEVPHAYLLIDAANSTSTLYLPPRNPKHEDTDGPMLCADDIDFAKAKTAVNDVKPLAALPDDLKDRTTIWLPRSEAEGMRMCQDTLRHRRRCIMADPMNAQPSPEAHLLSRVLAISPGATLHDLSPLLQRQRLIKSPAEIRLMRRAGQLAAQAVVEAMKAARPGLYEYQLSAIADYVYAYGGARGVGYRPIIATGPNIWMMHYWRNDSSLRDGELVLMDYAPDLNNYTSDIGRMFPVTGRFSPLHRQLYGLVIEYHKLLLSLIAPGKLPEQILQEASQRMRPVVDSWTFSKPTYHAAALKLLESKRPLSHGVGLTVHEAATYFGRPLQVGTVFAVDPELVVPEEKLYIRCEDTVVVTPDGCENLTASCPLDLDAVERLMASSSTKVIP